MTPLLTYPFIHAVSPLTVRFHLDLQSAVNAAAGRDDW